MKVKRILAVLLVLTMVFALVACSGKTGTEPSASPSASAAASPAATASASAATETATAGDVKYGGNISVYYQDFYAEFDPAVSSNRNYVAFFYDELWNLNWDTDRSTFGFTGSYLNSDYLTGQIADSWKVADDLSSMTVNLRKDVTFQNKTDVGMDAKYDIYGGRNLVAGDVKLSYDRLLGLDGATKVAPDQTNWPETLFMLTKVEVVDDYTVIFHFNTKNMVAINDFMCARVNICGPEWEKLTADQKSDWHYAAGSGPFILTDYITDNSMTMTKNPHYWQKDSKGNALPYVDTVTLNQITDHAIALSQFIAGKLDIVSYPLSVFDRDQTAQLKAAMKADQYSEYQYYNTPMGIGLKQGNNPVKALTDVRVREAMQYAIDLNAIESQFFGRDVSQGLKITGIWATDSNYNDYNSWPQELKDSYTTYDPDKAKALLAEAGYPDGFEFTCTIFSFLPTPLFQLVAQYLSEVGITMNLVVGNTPPDMIKVGVDANDPSSTFFNIFANNPAFAFRFVSKDGDNNFVHQNDAAIEDALQKVTSATSVADQVAAAKQLDQTYMAQHYLLYISGCEAYSNWFNARIKGLNGEAITPNYYMGYMLARTWVSDGK